MQDDWLHPDEVITYQRSKALATPVIQTAEYRAALSNIIGVDVGNFTCNSGDKLLVAFSAIEFTSGGKLSHVDDATGVFGADNAVNQLHLSLHQLRLGNGANKIEINYNSGFEHRCQLAFIDRETPANSRHCTSFQDVVAPFDGSVFGGISSIVATAGNDADIGSFDTSLTLKNMAEIGSVRIIRWTGNNSPPLSIIEPCLEWMWHEAAVKNNPILYPPLGDFVNN